MNLNQLTYAYDTDKIENPDYLRNYEEFFGALTGKEIRLLELGIHRGGSLELWRDYFQKGIIVGLDTEPVALHDRSGRIQIYQGAQQDLVLLDRIRKETAPEGFDLIIDDCSHIGVLSRISFWHLFNNHLKSGGIYVIEDWGTGYWDTWVDGVCYRSNSKYYSRYPYRVASMLTKIQMHEISRRIRIVRWFLAHAKSAVLRGQWHSHDFGMVGMIKELIDELGMKDITNPEFGVPPHRQSKFRQLHLFPSHLFVVKS
jgi:hypothetical protein